MADPEKRNILGEIFAPLAQEAYEKAAQLGLQSNGHIEGGKLETTALVHRKIDRVVRAAKFLRDLPGNVQNIIDLYGFNPLTPEIVAERTGVLPRRDQNLDNPIEYPPEDLYASPFARESKFEPNPRIFRLTSRQRKVMDLLMEADEQEQQWKYPRISDASKKLLEIEGYSVGLTERIKRQKEQQNDSNVRMATEEFLDKAFRKIKNPGLRSTLEFDDYLDVLIRGQLSNPSLNKLILEQVARAARRDITYPKYKDHLVSLLLFGRIEEPNPPGSI